MSNLSSVSFEFFPPRTEKGKQSLAQVRQQLSEVNPEYFSVTFGAGGATQETTLETALDIQKNDSVAATPHLSCIGSNKSDIVYMFIKLTYLIICWKNEKKSFSSTKIILFYATL